MSPSSAARTPDRDKVPLEATVQVDIKAPGGPHGTWAPLKPFSQNGGGYTRVRGVEAGTVLRILTNNPKSC